MIFIPLIEGKMPESPEALNKAMAAKTDAEREQMAKAQGELQDELGDVDAAAAGADARADR